MNVIHILIKYDERFLNYLKLGASSLKFCYHL